MATLQARLTSVFQQIGDDIQGININIVNLWNSIGSLSSQVSAVQPIQEFQNINAQNTRPEPVYLNKKTTDTGEVRYYVMGMPMTTQKNEIFLEANTSEGVKIIGLK